MRTLADLKNIDEKTVLVRVDFNVPISNGKITDTARIKAALPTIKYLLKSNAKVILISHLGRPKGKVNKEFSLEIVADKLSEFLDFDVLFAHDIVGEDAKEKKQNLLSGQLLLLENVRFDPRETSKQEEERIEFAELLCSGADYFVSDGFGVVHRKQASVYECAKILPSFAGFLLEKEITALDKVLNTRCKPYVAILGGAKVSDKLAVIDNLIKKADKIIIGGAMAFTFLVAQGYNVGNSLVDNEKVEVVKQYLKKAKDNGVDIVLPVDFVVAEKLDSDAVSENVDINNFPENKMGLDIGVKSQKLFAEEIKKSKVCVWNGPMGVFEIEQFSKGTVSVAKAIASSDAYSVVGGGDSAAAIKILGFEKQDFSHISTGGGASLELLEGKHLPGISVLGGYLQ